MIWFKWFYYLIKHGLSFKHIKRFEFETPKSNKISIGYQCQPSYYLFIYFTKTKYTSLVKMSFSTQLQSLYRVIIPYFHMGNIAYLSYTSLAFNSPHVCSLCISCHSRPSFIQWEGGTTIWVLRTTIVYTFQFLQLSIQYTNVR